MSILSVYSALDDRRDGLCHDEDAPGDTDITMTRD
jgi:hypothetical protein